MEEKPIDSGGTRELFLNSPMFSTCPSTEFTGSFEGRKINLHPRNQKALTAFLSVLGRIHGDLRRYGKFCLEHKKLCGNVDFFGYRSFTSAEQAEKYSVIQTFQQDRSYLCTHKHWRTVNYSMLPLSPLKRRTTLLLLQRKQFNISMMKMGNSQSTNC